MIEQLNTLQAELASRKDAVRVVKSYIEALEQKNLTVDAQTIKGFCESQIKTYESMLEALEK